MLDIEQLQFQVSRLLIGTGLVVRGAPFIAQHNGKLLEQSLGQQTDQQLGIMIGNVGQSLWPIFKRSSEFQNAVTNPLDTYSRRVMAFIADELGGQAVSPSDGPPYYPFQQWAVQAEGLRASPLGVLIHPQYGLWHAYRGALLFNVAPSVIEVLTRAQASRQQISHPCDSCQEKPCLDVCPIDAFGGSYQFKSCATYVLQKDNACHQMGCQARLACPIGKNHRYNTTQQRFHLHHFARKNGRACDE